MVTYLLFRKISFCSQVVLETEIKVKQIHTIYLNEQYGVSIKITLI